MNPLAWLIMVDGFVIDARHAPLEIQQLAFEKGLIPYIPEPKPRNIPDRTQQECKKPSKPPKPENPQQSKLF